MTEIMRVPVNEVAELTMGLELENLFEGVYANTSWITEDDVGDHELKRYISLLEDKEVAKHIAGLKLEEYEVLSLICTAMRYCYERTYLDELYEAVQKAVHKDIISSFEELEKLVGCDDIQFDLYSDDVPVEGQHNFLERHVGVSIDGDDVVFTGSVERLALSVIGAVHGYGMFYFSSLQEFNYQTEVEELDKKALAKTCLDHFHWLKEVPGIWGVDAFCQTDLAGLERYSSFGHTQFTSEDVKDATEDYKDCGG